MDMDTTTDEHATTRPTTDVTKACLDCGDDFFMTCGERLFFWRRAIPEPKRCPDCRARNRGRRPPRG